MHVQVERSPVRVRWVNPLGYDGYDEPISDFINRIKDDYSQIEVVSLDFSPSPDNLEYRAYEALAYPSLVHLARDCDQQAFDAMVIGCFYDTALEAARELSGETVVLAPCQASIQIAANLCNRFSIIVGQQKWVKQMKDRVHYYGYGDYLASMRSIGVSVADLQKDVPVTTEKILTAGRQAVEKDHAEALILGCTCTFGLHQKVQEELGIPVIDPIIATLKMAEFLGQMKQQFQLSPSRLGSCQPPPEAMIRQFGLFSGPAPIAKSITIDPA